MNASSRRCGPRWDADGVPAPPLGKLIVVGVGLIGGSFALALRSIGAVRSVVGVGRSRANLESAQRLGITDRTYTMAQSWHMELHDADVVLLAVPVGQMPELFAAIAPHLGAATIVTDAGSTKQDVIAAARASLGAALPRFVPGHPIAGTEHSGAAAAFSSLYRDKNVILTPFASTSPEAVARVRDCWMQCGGVVSQLDAARHDELFAAVSHLPHALAFALVGELAGRPDADDFFRYAAGGFRDFTRLASSHPEMWRDICIANRHALRTELASYRAALDRIERLLAAGDAAALEKLFVDARDARNAWLAGHADSSDV
jgi:prephenate dehydrogenase